MTEIQSIEYISDLENKYPVESWVVEGVYIWPYIKATLLSRIRGEELIHSNQNDSANSFKYIKRKIQQLFSLIFSSLPSHLDNDVFKSSVSDVLLVHHSPDRNIELKDGTVFDRLVDPFDLVLREEYRIYNLEVKGNLGKTIQDVHYMDGFFDRQLIVSKICSFFRHRSTLQGYDDFLGALKGDLKNEYQIVKVMLNIDYIVRMSRVYERILKAKCIKIVITADGTNMDNMALFIACHKQNIPSIEIQHGMSAASNICWYSSWNKLPKDGKYQMLPNIYWLWTSEDRDAMTKWIKLDQIAYNGGKPTMLVGKQLQPLIQDYSLFHEDGKKRILFSLQWGTEVPEWVIQMIMDTSIEYDWYIRKHPIYDDEQKTIINRLEHVPNVVIRNVEMVWLDYLLQNVDIHFTVDSSVVKEALLYGVKSIVCGQEDYFMEEIESKQVYIVKDRQQAQRYLAELMRFPQHDIDRNHEKELKNAKIFLKECIERPLKL